jgi:phycoerythrin-associated linker protein
MTLANAAHLNIERLTNTPSKENWANATENNKAALIRAMYRQVLGNQYVMASKRLEGPESVFKRGWYSSILLKGMTPTWLLRFRTR